MRSILTKMSAVGVGRVRFKNGASYDMDFLFSLRELILIKMVLEVYVKLNVILSSALIRSIL